MASYEMVADFHSMVTNSTLRVMVLTKWFNVGVRGVEGLDVMVVDEAASVTRNDYVIMFDDQIEEGEWYSLSKFSVMILMFKTEQQFTDYALSWNITLRSTKYQEEHRAM
ncbi:unnamed protein product [Microthlaspi erraticum]|uniref:Replication protein A 70 kDa DNA-binding subunit B/D first OB fold domain-containing protein n=1 Tax=Microthlaspi erraticum TaxID=1685480 RepID=A0A6D2HP83_9BRAS|nr:unnamed protein product [Microthlaspi erraticum]